MVSAAKVTLNCPRCGKSFTDYRCNGRIYCSRDCAKHTSGGRTHGESKTRLYQIWLDIKNRCYCKTSPGYAYYGARGIAVCKSWQANYVAFRDWSLANGYQANLEIDRRDVNGGYSPDNCRWATRTQQMQNTRKRRNAKTSKYKGVSRNGNALNWRVQIIHNGQHIHVGMFAREDDAARAYDAAATERFGEFASLNFPTRRCPILVLSRQTQQEIVIGDDIVVTIIEIKGNAVRIGISAPKDVPVDRREVRDAKDQEKK